MKVKISKPFKYYRQVVSQDEEANTNVSYEFQGSVNGNIYPVGGEVKRLAQTTKLNYSLMFLTNENLLQEGDLLSVYKIEADYQVVSIKRYSNHYEIGLKSYD